MKPVVAVSTVFLALVALAHLLRVAFGVPVVIGGASLPMWPSGVAFFLTGGLAVLLWRHSHR